MTSKKTALSVWNVVLVVALAITGVLAAIVPENLEAAGDWYVLEGESIQSAIDAAEAAGGGTVHVAAGTYYELITLKDDVVVQGAGAAVTTINADTDGDGTGDGSVVTAAHVESTTLDGFTITNGTGTHNGGYYDYYGGGLYNDNSSTTVSNCTFMGNTAAEAGGGVFNVRYNRVPVLTMSNCTFVGNSVTFGDGGGICNDGRVVVSNCTFSGNTADDNGGGIYTEESEYWGDVATVTDCIFSGNSATNGGGMFTLGPATVSGSTFSGNSATGDGGAMLSEYSPSTVINCTFSNNSASRGGAMYHSWVQATVTDCTFSGNMATYGGGMANDNRATISGHSSSYTVTDCTFSGNTATEDGGGMVNYEVSCVVTGSTFSSNSASHGGGMYNNWITDMALADSVFSLNSATDGGGMWNANSSPALTNCRFSSNSATGDGGGMYSIGSESLPVLSNCRFSGNSAADEGGGIYSSSSSAVLANCTLSTNSAREGGGMCNSSSSPSLTNCIFSSNSAGQMGGGISNSFSSPSLTNCGLFSNSARQMGGGISNNFSSPSLTNCTFYANSAVSDPAVGMGGGVSNTNSSPTLVNCTFYENSAGFEGGGIYNNFSSSPALTNCTFHANSASWGGGMYNIGPESLPTVANCILWGDTPDEIANEGASTPTVTYSDIDMKDLAASAYTGTGNINADPLLADASSGDLHLEPGSPCLDAGSNAAPSLPDKDFEGNLRVLDGNGDGTEVADMGADEFHLSNAAPVAVDDGYTIQEDTPYNAAAPGVLKNDTDADGDPLKAVLVSGPSKGTLILNADGSFFYFPSANFSGVAVFLYKANDRVDDSNVTTVVITVKPVNDAPVARTNSYSVDEDSILTVDASGVLANDTDVEGDPLTAVKVTDPANGTLTLNANGSFGYAPSADFNGTDTFTYKANDGTADSQAATVTITVNPVNDAPVANGDRYIVDEDDVLTVDAPGVLANDTDIDGDLLAAIWVSGPAHGTLNLNSDGSFVYTPEADFNGTDGFKYTANDGTADSDVAGVTITVTPVDDAPEIVPCDSEGNPRMQFAVGETVFVKGTGLKPLTEYRIWIQDHPVGEAETLILEEDHSGQPDEMITDASGNFGPVEVWAPAEWPTTYREFDVVVDEQNDGENTGIYNASSDGIASTALVGAAPPVPEAATVVLLGVGLALVGGLLIWRVRRATAA